MKTFFSVLLFILVFPAASFAQLELSGVWQGTITIGGIGTTDGYPMELYIERRGSRLTGRSYIHLSATQTIEMNLRGRMYDDLSMYFDEIEFVNEEGSTYTPPFMRKYQLAWRRSISGSSLNGYWQEIKNDVLGESRERGRIFLTKLRNKKA